MSQWYYRKADGLPGGPYSHQQLRELRESGAIRDTTFVWRTGWSEWTTFAEIWKSGTEPTTTATIDPPPAIPLRLAQAVLEAAPVIPTYAACSVCRDKWPENLLFSAGKIRMCAKCLKAREDRKRRKNGDNFGVFGEDIETSSWLLKLLFAGLLLAGIVIASLSFLGKWGN